MPRTRSRISSWSAALLTTVTAVGCATGSGDTPSPDAEPTSLTYYADAKPVLDRHCVSCHSADGAGPFALDTFDAVEPWKEAVVAAVEAGTMPPWMPDTDCRHYPGERVMSDDDKAILKQWVDDGAAEGDEADAVDVELPSLDLPNPSLSMTAAEPYTPDPARPDDYRCLLLDQDFDVDTFITGYQVVPDKKEIVHHVLLYVVPPESLDEFNQVDAAEEGPGFTCFSDPGVDSMLFGTWVPGAPATTLPNNIGFEVPAGSKLAMQVHYNLVDNAPVADQTAVEVQLADTTPLYSALNLVLAESDFEVPPGQSSYVAEGTFENTFPFPVTIISSLPHMHLLGRSIRFDHVDAEGTETCIVDIPDWDFNWQQTYDLAPDDFIVVEPGESTKVTCEWDNSAENQPVVNGERLEPATVHWGEGTLEEMCVVIITAIPDRL